MRNNFVFNFEAYLKRQSEEERLEEMRRQKEERSRNEDDYGSQGSQEESSDIDTPSGLVEEATINNKNKKSKKSGDGAFKVNTSMCRSELELLQHEIFKNKFKETRIGGELYWFALALNPN
jgi:hypothetical protein